MWFLLLFPAYFILKELAAAPKPTTGGNTSAGLVNPPTGGIYHQAPNGLWYPGTAVRSRWINSTNGHQMYTNAIGETVDLTLHPELAPAA